MFPTSTRRRENRKVADSDDGPLFLRLFMSWFRRGFSRPFL